MNFDLLLPDSLKRTMEMAANEIGSDVDLIDLLYHKSLEQQGSMALRVSRVFDLCLEKHPDLAVLYNEKLVFHLPILHNESVKRNFLRILGRGYQPLSEKSWTNLLNICIDFLISRKEATAVRAYCMDVLYLMACEEPDLKPEICYALESACIDSSAAINGRAKRFLKKMKKK